MKTEHGCRVFDHREFESLYTLGVDSDPANDNAATATLALGDGSWDVTMHIQGLSGYIPTHEDLYNDGVLSWREAGSRIALPVVSAFLIEPNRPRSLRAASCECRPLSRHSNNLRRVP